MEGVRVGGRAGICGPLLPSLGSTALAPLFGEMESRRAGEPQPNKIRGKGGVIVLQQL